MKVLDGLGLSSLFKIVKDFHATKSSISSSLSIADNKKINTVRTTSHTVGDKLIYSKGLILECIESGTTSSLAYDFDDISSIAFVMPENGTITITCSATYPHIVQYARKNQTVFSNSSDFYWTVENDPYFKATKQNYIVPFTVQEGEGVVFYLNVPNGKTAGDYLTITLTNENQESYDLNDSTFSTRSFTKSFVVPFTGDLTITSNVDYDTGIQVATSSDEAFTVPAEEYWLGASNLQYDLSDESYTDSVRVYKDDYITTHGVIEKTKTVDEVFTYTLTDGTNTVVL